MRSTRRDELRAYLEQHGVRTLLQWGGHAVHQFKNLGFDVSLPKTTLMTSQFIMLPMNTSLVLDDQGSPIISRFDSIASHLTVVRCADPMCTPHVKVLSTP